MNNVVSFLAGATIASVVTYFISKKYFEKKIKDAEERANNEIKSVVDTFKNMENEMKNGVKNAEENANKALDEYRGNEKEQTTDKGNNETTTEVKDTLNDEDNDCFIIGPDEYGADETYEVISLIFYSKNKILTYDYGSVVNHIDELFDEEFLNHFGEYEEDMLYIRDKIHKTDYDIEYRNEKYVSGKG